MNDTFASTGRAHAARDSRLSRLLCLAVALAVVQTLGANPFAEGVRATEPLAPEQQQKAFRLPEGFEIQLVAAEPDLRKPMNMAFDARGRLWVSESVEYPFAAPADRPGRDTIRIFSDFDESGRARKVEVFADGLNIPIGVLPYGDGCIAWSIPNIWFLRDTDGDGKADKREILFGPLGWEKDTHGNIASLRRGLDGWIYGTHGFNNTSTFKAKDGSSITLQSGNTYRFRPDGSRVEQFTWGQVNPFGMCMDPLGNFYTADCHSSPIYQIIRGAHYPSFGKPHDGLGFAPTVIQHSHGSTAISGIAYISDPSWPVEFQNNMLIGNVMTSRVNRDRITFHGSSPKGTEMPDFLACDDPWFRPVDLQWGPDGALYIADFYNRIIGHYEVPLTHPGRDRDRGRIWRVVYKGQSAAGVSPAKGATTAGKMAAALPDDLPGLITELGSPNPTRRILAQHTLTDRFGVKAVPQLKNAASGIYEFPTPEAKALSRVHALWVLLNLNQLDDATLVSAIADENPLVRVHLMRILAEIGHRAFGKVAGAMRTNDPGNIRALALQHSAYPDPHVRRAAAEALGAWPAAGNAQPLLAMLHQIPNEDTHLRHTVRVALRDQLAREGSFGSLDAAALSAADWRALAGIAVAVTNSDAASFLLRHLERYSEDAETSSRYLRHAVRHAAEAHLNDLPEFARQIVADDIDTQFALFKSVQEGVRQRGAALPSSVKEWGAELAGKLLASTKHQAAWVNTFVAGAPESRNPWAFQERPCADGQKALVMSSFPNGETLTGVLRSAPFPLPARISFYLCGHDGPPGKPAQGNNFVRLVDAATKQVLREVAPPRNDTARKVTWEFTDGERRASSQGAVGILPAETTSTAGERPSAQSRFVYFEATDGDTGKAYAWLAFGRFEPALPQLALNNPDQDSRRQQAAADIASSLKLGSLEPEFVGLFESRAADGDARASAAKALAVLNPKAHLPALSRVLMDAREPAPLRDKVATALAETLLPEATASLVEALRAAPERTQLKIAAALAAYPGGAESLIRTVEAGQVPPALLLNRQVRDRLNASRPANHEQRLAALTASVPPRNQTLQKLVEQRAAAYSAARASVAEGRRLYDLNCRACHQLDREGGLIGPQLDGIGSRGPERLIEDILDPNRNVDHAFRYSTVTLTDDSVITGLFRREVGELLVFADTTGQEISVPKNRVRSRVVGENSLMPDNFGEHLSADELNHIVRFLMQDGREK